MPTLGQPLSARNRRKRERLRTISELYRGGHRCRCQRESPPTRAAVEASRSAGAVIMEHSSTRRPRRWVVSSRSGTLVEDDVIPGHCPTYRYKSGCITRQQSEKHVVSSIHLNDICSRSIQADSCYSVDDRGQGSTRPSIFATPVHWHIQCQNRSAR